MKYFILFLFTPLFVQAEALKVASWNVSWLGSHKFNNRSASDYAELSRYAKQLDADVIALQEVESTEYARKVFGIDYDYYFSTDNWIQRVGVAVKKSIGYSVKSVEIKSIDVGRVRRGLDLTLTNGDKQMRLLAVHLKSGCFNLPLDSKSVNSMPDNSKRKDKLKNACTKLSKQINPVEKWIDARAQESVPFVVIGDFNRRFNQDVALNHSETEGFWQAIDDEGNEDMWTPTLTLESKCWGGYYKDFIDHVVLDPKAKNKYVIGSFEQLVFDQKYTKELSRNLSDHCPISLELNL